MQKGYTLMISFAICGILFQPLGMLIEVDALMFPGRLALQFIHIWFAKGGYL